MQMWRRFRKEVNALSDAVGLVEFVDDSNLFSHNVVTQPALIIAQGGKVFQFHSALGIREVILSAMSCLGLV